MTHDCCWQVLQKHWGACNTLLQQMLLLVVFCAGRSSSMRQLDLSFNKLGDSAARALAHMMAVVPLLVLDLEGNQVRLLAGTSYN